MLTIRNFTDLFSFSIFTDNDLNNSIVWKRDEKDATTTFIFTIDIPINIETSEPFSWYCHDNLFKVMNHGECSYNQFISSYVKQKWYNGSGCVVCREKDLEYEEFQISSIAYFINNVIKTYTALNPDVRYIMDHKCRFIKRLCGVDECLSCECFCGHTYTPESFTKVSKQKYRYLYQYENLCRLCIYGSPTNYVEFDDIGKHNIVYFLAIIRNGKIHNPKTLNISFSELEPFDYVLRCKRISYFDTGIIKVLVTDCKFNNGVHENNSNLLTFITSMTNLTTT